MLQLSLAGNKTEQMTRHVTVVEISTMNSTTCALHLADIEAIALVPGLLEDMIDVVMPVHPVAAIVLSMETMVGEADRDAKVAEEVIIVNEAHLHTVGVIALIKSRSCPRQGQSIFSTITRFPLTTSRVSRPQPQPVNPPPISSMLTCE